MFALNYLLVKVSELSVDESLKTWSNQNFASSQWSALLFCTHWHCLRPPHSKGTFTTHHYPGLPALCSQNRLSCTDTDCDIAHKLKRQPMRGLHSCPGHCLIGPIYPTEFSLLPLLSLLLTYPPFSRCQVPLKFTEQLWMGCLICCWGVFVLAPSAEHCGF